MEQKKMGKKTKVGLCSVSIALLLVVLPLVPSMAAAASRPEGTLIAAMPDLATEGFLPDRNSTTSSGLWEGVYDYLIYSNHSDGTPIPGLAERWEYSKDYRTLTFYLRKGVQFHDGWGELTAEDVRFTIELNKRPTSLNVKKLVMANIEKMDVVDRYTLVIRLNKPDPLLWMNFCTSEDMGSPILCKKYVESVGEEKANRQPIGSGPYRLVEHKLGESAKFEALEKHWLVIPEFKYIIVRLVPEETTAVAMLKTGEVDLAEELAMDKIAELNQAGIKTITSMNSNTTFIPFGGMLTPADKRYVEGYHRKDPWKDVRVREAMNLAVDRQSIAKHIYKGAATPSAIYASMPGWDKLDPIPYDPKRAKQLLADAGFPNGFGFKFMTHVKDPSLQLVAQTVSGYWEAIGLKPEIIRGDYAAWRDTNKAGKTAGAVWTNVMMNYFDWSARLPGHDLPNSSTPFWQSEETVPMINKVLAETDPKKREAYWKEVAQLYRSLYINVPIAFTPRVHGVSKKIGEWGPARVRYPRNLIFARQAKPLDTWRLFTP